MTKSDADRFRRQADKCRQMAAKALGLEKEEWLDLANYWLKKAEDAEKGLP